MFWVSSIPGTFPSTWDMWVNREDVVLAFSGHYILVRKTRHKTHHLNVRWTFLPPTLREFLTSPGSTYVLLSFRIASAIWSLVDSLFQPLHPSSPGFICCMKILICLWVVSHCFSRPHMGRKGNLPEGYRCCQLNMLLTLHCLSEEEVSALEKRVSPGFRVWDLWWCRTTDQIYGIQLISFRKYFFLWKPGLRNGMKEVIPL